MNDLTQVVKFGLILELPYPPSMNRYWRTWRGRVLLSREGRAYKIKAGSMALAQRVRPMAGPLCVSLWVYRPQRRRDLDNELKAIFDAMNGIAWVDDSQIVEIHAYRRDDKARPRVEIKVTLQPRDGEN